MKDFLPYLFTLILIVAFLNVILYQRRHASPSETTQTQVDLLGQPLTETISARSEIIKKRQKILFEDRADRRRQLQQQRDMISQRGLFRRP